MGVCISAGLTMWQMWQMPRASGLKGSGGTRVFAARGKRLVAAPPIRSAIDILMVTTMSLAWTACHEQYAELEGVYLRNDNSRRIRSAMQTQFARSGRMSEFHISPLQMWNAQCRPGRMPPFAPPSAATVQGGLRK